MKDMKYKLVFDCDKILIIWQLNKSTLLFFFLIKLSFIYYYYYLLIESFYLSKFKIIQLKFTIIMELIKMNQYNWDYKIFFTEFVFFSPFICLLSINN